MGTVAKEAAMTLTHQFVTRTAAVGFTLALVWGAITFAQDPEALETDEPGWIREDIEAGYAEALATGKPLLVVFR